MTSNNKIFRDIYYIIRTYTRNNLRPPTLREILNRSAYLRSTSATLYRLDQMVKIGLLAKYTIDTKTQRCFYIPDMLIINDDVGNMGYDKILVEKDINITIIRQPRPPSDDSIPRKAILDIFHKYPDIWHVRHAFLQKMKHGEVRIHRVLNTLVDENFIERSHSGKRVIYKLIQ